MLRLLRHRLKLVLLGTIKVTTALADAPILIEVASVNIVHILSLALPVEIMSVLIGLVHRIHHLIVLTAAGKPKTAAGHPSLVKLVQILMLFSIVLILHGHRENVLSDIGNANFSAQLARVNSVIVGALLQPSF